MPTELEELVEFLHHGNSQIRQIATQNLVPYSKTQPSIFKTTQLTPIKDLKLLIRDYAPIAQHALTILINISGDGEVLTALAEDAKFLESMLGRITDAKEANADSLCMLLANLSKSESLSRLLGLKRVPVPALSSSPLALDQLTHLFNRGANKGYNSKADYDYLAYVFADLAKFLPIATHFTSPSLNDPSSLPPLTLLTPFTMHPSPIRRLGLSSLLHNLSLSLPSSGIHPLLSSPLSILPDLLLPLCSPDPKFSESEIDSLLPELQLLERDHRREPDLGILKTLIETLYVLVGKGGKEVRLAMKEAGAYLVVRELHLEIEDDGVRAACEKVVDVLMIDGEDGGTDHNLIERKEGGEEVEGARVEAGARVGAVMQHFDAAEAKNPLTETKAGEEPLTKIPPISPSQSEKTVPTTKSPPHITPTLPNTAIPHDSEDEDEDEDNNRIVEIF